MRPAVGPRHVAGAETVEAGPCRQTQPVESMGMLRLTDIKLPLDHDAAALPAAIVARLGIQADELTGYSVARRSHDARKRGAISLI